MALKETITTARKFADDTILLASYITNADLFYKDGYQHNRAMKLAASYSQTDTQELINSIFDAVDDSHNLQLVFDLWKNQLNTITLPNYDYAHFYREFGGLKYYDEATDIFETLLSVCGDLKNQIAYFMEENRITDNSPKLGFLCPLFYEDDKVTADEETSQQEAIKQPVASKPQHQIEFSNNADTNKAIWGLLDRLKAVGWIDDGYRWKKGATKQLIAYWVERVSLNFNLSNTYINEKFTIKWKPFERLFGLKDGTLKTAKQSWLKVNTLFTPTRYEEIEPYTKVE